jgi:hypothetical protein
MKKRNLKSHATPEVSKALYDRIRSVRREFGNLVFHFTRTPDIDFVEIQLPSGGTISMKSSAYAILNKILHEEKLIGTSKWTYGYNCVCFTEAPIREFVSIFSRIETASIKEERPRYEPYGIAVSKKWLFQKGGRPVIYDDPASFDTFPDNLRYRFVPYDPEQGIDFTWEREWRVKTDFLMLDPKETLIIVPTSKEAFDIVKIFSDLEADWDESQPIGVYDKPKWVTVSLDLFGYKF